MNEIYTQIINDKDSNTNEKLAMLLLLRFEEKVNDSFQDLDKLLRLINKHGLIKDDVKTKLFDVFNKIFELKTSLNKLLA